MTNPNLGENRSSNFSKPLCNFDAFLTDEGGATSTDPLEVGLRRCLYLSNTQMMWTPNGREQLTMLECAYRKHLKDSVEDCALPHKEAA